MAINENGVQVERQYIGARYVPKFFQGVNGSPEWVNGLQYEPLTIVTYLGNSFTSKVPVPAGVGNPADNPTYWVNTGNYNAQVDAYREEVAGVKSDVAGVQADLNAEIQNRENSYNELNDKINNVKNMKNVIIIGDSYGTPSDSWVNLLKTKLINADNVYTVSKGGAGFTTSVLFLTMLQEITAQLSDEVKTNTTHIIVCGGANDALKSSSINGGLLAFSNYVSQNFPNALIYLGFIGWMHNTESDYKYTRALAEYAKCNTVSPIMLYLTNVEWVMHNRKFMSDDLLHPNSNGSMALAGAIANAVLRGSCDVIFPFDQVDLANTSLKIYEWFVNGIVNIGCPGPITFTLPSTITITATGNESISPTQMNYSNGQRFSSTSGTLVVFSVNDDGVEHTGVMRYINGNFSLYPLTNIQNVSKIKMSGFQLSYLDID